MLVQYSPARSKSIFLLGGSWPIVQRAGLDQIMLCCRAFATRSNTKFNKSEAARHGLSGLWVYQSFVPFRDEIARRPLNITSFG